MLLRGALALYCILLCGVRVDLIRRVSASSGRADYEKELLTYRTTGVLMILDIALGGSQFRVCTGDRAMTTWGT